MKLSEYFDPHNSEHVDLYVKVHLFGYMPDEFKLFMAENSIAQDFMWDVIAAQKMAKAWVGAKTTLKF